MESTRTTVTARERISRCMHFHIVSLRTLIQLGHSILCKLSKQAVFGQSAEAFRGFSEHARVQQRLLELSYLHQILFEHGEQILRGAWALRHVQLHG